ncbi:MAG: hypothetical protein PVJ55_10145 [Anaerolineae bacterium]
MDEPRVETLSETKDFEVWLAQEPDGEMTFHVELGLVTLHFFREEWDELIELIETAKRNAEG